MKGIYDLKLHDSLQEKNLTVVRVPGGWLYKPNGSPATLFAFVPYTEEIITSNIVEPVTIVKKPDLEIALNNVDRMFDEAPKPKKKSPKREKKRTLDSI